MQQVMLCENKANRKEERFWVVGLDNTNKVQFLERVELNTDPFDIFKMAIHKLAGRLILVQNHPSGAVDASQADLDYIDNLIKVGRLLDVKVIDHLTVSEKEFRSLADEGIMEQLEQSGKFEVVDSVKPGLKQWRIQLESGRTRREEAPKTTFGLIKDTLLSVLDYLFEGNKKFAQLERIKIENEMLKTKSEVDKILKEEAELKNQLLQHEINVKLAEHLKELGYSEEHIQNIFEQTNQLTFSPLNVVAGQKS